MNEIAILLLLLASFPIIAIIALVKALGAGDRLRQLETRITTLEARVSPGAAAAAPTTVTPPVAPVPPIPAAPPREAPKATEPAPAQSAPPESISTQPSISFEERFGTRWTVWVGGLALALGGIFLVRYTIEQGLIGPRLRLFLAGLFAIALIATGEWSRRKEQLAGLVALPTAHIPSILTAAGTTVAYATVYAAYALYGFLSPPAAFVMLGAVALATLAAALLHGPALAALGLVGAYVTPLLVASAAPDYWALYIYLAVVTAAAFALARVRLWRWLAITAVTAGVLWILPGVEGVRVEALAPHAFHAIAGLALAAALIVSGFLYGPAAEPGKIDGVSSAAIAAYLFAAALLVLASRHEALALAAFTLLAVATIALAWRAPAATAAIPAAAALVAVILAQWAVYPTAGNLIVPGGAVLNIAPEPMRTDVGLHLVFGAGFAALFGLAGFFAQARANRPPLAILWAACGVLAPIAILIALYYRIAGFERSVPFAAIALLLAALFGWATETLLKRAPSPGVAAAGAIHAAATVAALALAITFALEKGWLTVGLALMVPGVAWISEKRPLPLLRWLIVVLVAIVIARIGYEPRIVGQDVGTTPIFNWLLYGYGVPALSFWVAGRILRRRADDIPTRATEAAAILFTVLLAFLEIRHFMNDGDVYRRSAGLAELALQVTVGIAMTIGLEHVRVRSRSMIHDLGAIAVAAVTVAAIVFGLGFSRNPLLTGEPVGGAFVNLILLGYGLPAVLAIALALVTRTIRPMQYRACAAAISVILALAYLSLEVRTLYHGPVLSGGGMSQAELYSYSAVWLSFGVILLIAGFYLRSQPARLAAAAVIVLTIGKVFLVDMAGLAGIYRVLSLVGLGLVLMGIGLLYQRRLFPARAADAAPARDGPV